MLPRASATKRYERFLLERFFEAADLRSEIIEERETPDFIVRIEEQLVGIEITQLYRSFDASQRLEQAHESISSRIVHSAQQLYEKSGATPVNVTVTFRPGSSVRSLNRNHSAVKLARFVQTLDLPEWQTFNRSVAPGDQLLPEGISFIRAFGVPTYRYAHWSVARAGWVGPITAELVQSRIDVKAKHLRNYDANVTEYWLVLIADSLNPSQMIEIRPDFDATTISSPFARTFIYSYPRPTVVEVRGVAA